MTNKKIPLRLLSLTLTVIMFAGCATLFTKGGADYRAGERAYNSKDYVTSVSSVLEALHKNPEFPEALELFPRAFNEGTNYYLTMIDQAKSSTDPFAYDTVYTNYQALQAMNQAVKATTRNEVSTSDYSDELADAKEKAADAHYLAGLDLLNARDYQSARAAVTQFNATLSIDSDYLDTSDLRNQAIEEGTINLAIYSTGALDLEYMVNLELEDQPFLNVTTIETTSLNESELSNSVKKTGDVDIILFIDGTISQDSSRNETEGRGPYPQDFFKAVTIKRSYTKSAICYYSIINGATGAVIKRDQISTNDSQSLTVTLLKSDELIDVNLDGLGKSRLVVANAYEDSYELNQAISSSSRFINNLRTPGSISNEASQTQWLDYFKSEYRDLSDFLADYSDITMFYDVEAIHVTSENIYYVLGDNTIASAEAFKNKSVAVYNGIAYATEYFADQAANELGSSMKVSLGSSLADILRPYL